MPRLGFKFHPYVISTASIFRLLSWVMTGLDMGLTCLDLPRPSASSNLPGLCFIKMTICHCHNPNLPYHSNILVYLSKINCAHRFNQYSICQWNQQTRRYAFTKKSAAKRQPREYLWALQATIPYSLACTNTVNRVHIPKYLWCFYEMPVVISKLNKNNSEDHLELLVERVTFHDM